MQLEFADFVHHYDGYGLTDDQKHTHFDTFASIMECVVRIFWREDGSENPLGIKFDGVSLSLDKPLESKDATKNAFNAAASHDAAGKKEP